MAKIRASVLKEKRTLLLAVITLLIYITFTFVSTGFGSSRTLANIIYANASLLICSISMTFVVMMGGIDLSIAATNAFAGIIAVKAMKLIGGETPTGIGIGLAGVLVAVCVCVVIGVLNSAISVCFNQNPFIVTLATQFLVRGLALGFSDSRSIGIKNDLLTFIGQKPIPGTGIPAVLLLIIVLYLIAGFLLGKTVLGRKVMAVGGNRDAASASGIRPKQYTVFIYALAGIFVGLATIVTVGRSNAAHPNAALNAEMEIITVVVLSGTSLAGGEGNMRTTFIAAILLAIINTGLQRLEVSPYMQYVIKGALILIAIGFDQANRTFKETSNKNTLNSAAAQANLEKVTNLVNNSQQDVISLEGISKSFPGVKALDDVSLTVKCGTVHAVCGENGAGKSTLMKVLSGVYKMDEGTIKINGIPIDIKSPMTARNLGISVIYQEFSLVPELNVSQNVFLGKEKTKDNGVILDKSNMNSRTRDLLESFGMELDVEQRTFDHTVGQLQAIEIAKALSTNAWVLVMDEPTSAITEADKERLFKIIRNLKEQNVAIVYISHRLSEIFEIADEITVLRDGKTVFNAPVKGVTEKDLIRHMVGRELNNIFYRDKHEGKETVLEVKDLYRKNVFAPISFKVRAGEVLGFSGLMGSGRTEIMRCIYGLDKADSGTVIINGKECHIGSPSEAIEMGIGYVSEDRRREGIVPHMGVGSNITLATLNNINKNGIIDKKKEEGIIQTYIDKLMIRTPSVEQRIENLSGGNQQKCCLAKCLANNPQIIIMDEPTRGIDVGAKAEIHKLIDGLAKEGKAIIIISSELPEIIGACDRIIVLHEGVKKAELNACRGDAINQEILISYASGNEDSLAM